MLFFSFWVLETGVVYLDSHVQKGGRNKKMKRREFEKQPGGGGLGHFLMRELVES